jgi:hypothetical protein
MAQLTKTLGWLPHTVRAALTGLRKSGFTIQRVVGKAEEAARYRNEDCAYTELLVGYRTKGCLLRGPTMLANRARLMSSAESRSMIDPSARERQG